MRPGTANRHFFEGPRFCMRCREHRPRSGGRMEPTGKYTEQWVCAKHVEAK